jgi:hypothetical protein
MDEVASHLPEDTPQSLVLLVSQCAHTDVSTRPEASDVVEWLQDLYDSTPDDEIPIPTMRTVSDLSIPTPASSGNYNRSDSTVSTNTANNNNNGSYMSEPPTSPNTASFSGTSSSASGASSGATGSGIGSGIGSGAGAGAPSSSAPQSPVPTNPSKSPSLPPKTPFRVSQLTNQSASRFPIFNDFLI